MRGVVGFRGDLGWGSIVRASVLPWSCSGMTLQKAAPAVPLFDSAAAAARLRWFVTDRWLDRLLER
jgi:hypothetical protein